MLGSYLGTSCLCLYFLICSLIFLANLTFEACPGRLAMICALNGKPTSARSPTTSRSLCLAGSFGKRSFRLLSIPSSLTLTSCLLKTLDILFTWSSVTGLSTTTIALLISPPLIRLLASSHSSSWKNEKVRQGAISLLNWVISFSAACWVPSTGELKSISVLMRYSL